MENQSAGAKQKKKAMKIGIIGLGEVGGAIKELNQRKHTVFARDLSFDEISGKTIDILHLCYPYNDTFVQIAQDAIKEIKPQLTIINSTTKPGTTQQIHDLTKADIVHSPFMGVHPIKPKGEFSHPDTRLKLFDYFAKFPKVIGPTTPRSAIQANDYFVGLGLTTEIFNSAKDTELAKILSTTYYGWNILFEKWVHQLCSSKETNFDQVYTRYNQIYNAGYQESLPHVVRPVLKHHQGKIGGHCVMPNAAIIQEWLKDEFTAFMIEQNEKLKEA